MSYANDRPIQSIRNENSVKLIINRSMILYLFTCDSNYFQF